MEKMNIYDSHIIRKLSKRHRNRGYKLKGMGDFLRRRRKEKHISCRTIAKKLNVSWWTVRKLEKPFYRLLDEPPSMLVQVYKAMGGVVDKLTPQDIESSFENDCDDGCQNS